MVFQDRSNVQASRLAMETTRILSERAESQGLTDIEVIGPAPGMPSRIRGRYRWHLSLRGPSLLTFIEGMEFPGACTVDVDPVHIL